MEVNLKEARCKFEKLGSRYKGAENIEVEKEKIEGVVCYWIHERDHKSSDAVIFYLHGGCFALGSIDSHKALVSHLAIETDSTFLFIEYSLAPENPFPAAVNEVLKVYNRLAHTDRFTNISFMGDSAGPGLITSVVSALNRRKDNTNLGRCVMISPWVDLRNNSDSIADNKSIDPVLTKEGLDLFTSLYVGGDELSKANPIETVFGNFPPTLIMAGTNEILLDDSKILHSKISANQPLTWLSVYDDQAHVWLMDDIKSPASRQAIEEIRVFLSAGS